MEVLGLVMDILLLLFLAATMFIGWRLTKSINVFRKSRKELDKLVQDLSRQIERADGAVSGLKNTARDAGQGLQSLIGESRALSEELQLMTQSGDALAMRLERLAERNREIAERIERAGVSAPMPAQPAPQREDRPVAPVSGFSIRDRDIEFGDDVESDDDRVFASDDQDDGHSRAERELMAAMKRNAKARAAKTSTGGVT